MNKRRVQLAAPVLSAALATAAALATQQASGATFSMGDDIYLSSAYSGFIGTPDKLLDQRFTAPQDITLDRATMFVNVATGGTQLEFSIQSDNAGSPSGTILGSGSTTVPSYAASLTAYTADFTAPVTLQGGQTYHLIAGSPNADGTNYLLLLRALSGVIKTINPPGAANPANAMLVRDNASAAWRGFWDTETFVWSLSNSSSNAALGQPYFGSQYSNFGGNVWVGQKFKYTGGSGALSKLSIQLNGTGGTLSGDVRVHVISVAGRDPDTGAILPGADLFSSVLIPQGTTPSVDATMYSLEIPEASRPALASGQDYLLVVDSAEGDGMQICYNHGVDWGVGTATTNANFQALDNGFLVLSTAEPVGGVPPQFYDWDETSTDGTLFKDARFMIDVIVAEASAWNVDDDGNWSVAGNWTGGVPNAVGAIANFGGKITSAHTVTVDAPQTVGTINFDNSNSYTLAGSNAITLNVNSGQAAINVTAGSHTIDAPIVLAKDTAVSIGGGGALAVRSMRGAGLSISGGTMKITAKAAANDPSGTSVVTSLSVGAGAALDLTNNSAVIDYSGAVGTLVEDTRQMLENGSLISSSADATKNLGYADNAALGMATFAGQTVDSSSLLIKYTYLGDTNLDGKVDVVDLGNLATAWQTNGVWANGDSNYDGLVDVIDLGLLATNWQAGVGSPLGPGSLDQALAAYGLPSVAVPEPACFAMLGLAGLLAARRRH